MKDIVLIQPPNTINWFLQALGTIHPHLALPYLGAVLECAGFSVRIIDSPVEGRSAEDVAEIVEADQPILVGFTAHTAEFPSAERTARKIKERYSVPIIIGGVHSYFSWKDILSTRDTPFDYCAVGECENTIEDIVDAVQGKKSIGKIKGVAFRNNHTVISPQPNPVTEDLDMIPFPALHLLGGFPNKYGFDLSVGIDSTRNIKGKRSLTPLIPMVTSRGCSHSCEFCQVKAKDRKWRGRSPQNVIDEIEYRLKEFGIRYFYFYEDNFTEDAARVKSFCNLLSEHQIDITWDCFSRADWVVQHKDLVELMAKTGCRGIYMGVEALENGLKYYKKGETIGDVAKATQLLREHGIEIAWSFVLGSPVDTLQGLKDTIKFIEMHQPDFIQLFVLCPFPGTDLYFKLKEAGEIKEIDWTKFDAQNPVLRYHNFSVTELLKIRNDAYRSFYGRFSWCLKYTNSLRRGKHPLANFTKAIGTWLKMRFLLSEVLSSDS
jgi:radical SAM superfamily enzyme YgiQ (UPF0313 family)